MGGGSWPALYCEKGLLFDTFPIGQKYKNIKNIEINLLDRKNNHILNENEKVKYRFCNIDKLNRNGIDLKLNDSKYIISEIKKNFPKIIN